jgi:hypothetical protein
MSQSETIRPGRAQPETQQLHEAAQALSHDGFVVLPAALQADLIGATRQDWKRLDRHWDELTLDGYMRDGGTYRYRRYTFDVGEETLQRLPHRSYRQETSVNPFNVGIDRHLAPLPDVFAAEPLVAAIVAMLGRITSAAARVSRWTVELHPFRIVTSESQLGKPAPQGPPPRRGQLALPGPATAES